MGTLFDGDGPDGWRLARFELYNWGSFDGKIHSLEPSGETSLLTGANGSGKTTIVDAIVTLLVPPPKRHYNQSSGSDQKHDRSEKSYFLGSYGRIREEERLTASTQNLREPSTHSILVGAFRCSAGDRACTLGQVRWMTGGNLQQTYFLVNRELALHEILPVDKQGDWKRLLRERDGAFFFDSFPQYALHFSSLFGLRSEKALSLFSQTVGVKVLGNLNEFIRANMFEERDIQTEFRKLNDNYENLLASHLEIEKAQDQLALLEPVIEQGARFEELSEETLRLDALHDALPALFAERKRTFLRERVRELDEDLGAAQRAREEIEREIGRLDDDVDTVRGAMSRDSAALRIQRIDQELKHDEETRDERRGVLKDYEGLASRSGYGPVRSEEEFIENRKRAERDLETASAKIAEETEAYFRSRSALQDRERELSEITSEIDSLVARASNIPRSNLEIRSRIAEALGCAEAELPFAGELIRVRGDAAEWEQAIERLLHSFALCVLVPEARYRKATTFVRDHDLRGRLVYFRVPGRFAKLLARDVEPDSVVRKIEIKSGCAEEEWLSDYLEANFNYRCVEDIEQFARLSRGITKSGLIKNDARHEKDDRFAAGGRERYVLGWDNREKLLYLKRQARELETERGTLLADARRRSELLEKTRERQAEIQRLLGYADYSKLDWKSIELRIEKLLREREELVRSSETLAALEAKLAALQTERKAAGERRDRLIERIQSTRDALAASAKRLAEQEAVLALYANADLSVQEAAIGAYLPHPLEGLDLDGIDGVEKTALDRVVERQRILASHLGESQRKLERAMQTFCQPPELIIGKYPGWSAEAIDLRPDSGYLGEYRAVHKRIRQEDLPRFQKKFRQYLNDRMLEDLVSFNETLSGIRGEIESGIAELNSSLARIRYGQNPPTYLELEARPVADTDIRDFRARLRDSVADAAKIAMGDEAEMEHTFHKMKDLIVSLRGDDGWRKKVLDVRNWLQFAAIERFSADDAQRQYYADSQSLSGGEKAKLAYTILASAIAFQFGINDRPLDSFRFVVVDETFSKVDPENATYAMELFSNLGLQLMVVTPLDKINLVEGYIKTVHYTENKDRMRSAVFTLDIERYHEMKEELSRKAAARESGARTPR